MKNYKLSNSQNGKVENEKIKKLFSFFIIQGFVLLLGVAYATILSNDKLYITNFKILNETRNSNRIYEISSDKNWVLLLINTNIGDYEVIQTIIINGKKYNVSLKRLEDEIDYLKEEFAYFINDDNDKWPKKSLIVKYLLNDNTKKIKINEISRDDKRNFFYNNLFESEINNEILINKKKNFGDKK